MTHKEFEIALKTEVTGNEADFRVVTFKVYSNSGIILHFLTKGWDVNKPSRGVWVEKSKRLLTNHTKMIEAFYFYGSFPIDIQLLTEDLGSLLEDE